MSKCGRTSPGKPLCYSAPTVTFNFTLPADLVFIFDMDGVVIHSTALHTVAWEQYLDNLNIPSAGIMSRMLGKRNDQIVLDIFGDTLTPEEVAEHGFAKERLYRELMAPVFEENLVPGVVDFIQAAHAAGVRIALATNAEPLNVDFVLGRAGVLDCFRAIVDGHQVSKPKPDPEVYLEAAKRLGAAPQRAVVFEDSPGGMQAAKTAGARLVGLLTTLTEAPLADLAIPDFRDPRLMDWLRQLR